MYGEAGKTLKLGTINKDGLTGAACTGDTYMGLYWAAGMGAWGTTTGRVVYNDDSSGGTGICSFISYVVPSGKTGVYKVQGGCASGSYCSGTIVWKLV